MKLVGWVVDARFAPSTVTETPPELGTFGLHTTMAASMSYVYSAVYVVETTVTLLSDSMPPELD